jgi:hypothetical protein
MWARLTKLLDESAKERDRKRVKETENEKPEFTSNKDHGDTAVSALAHVLASDI